MATVRKTDCEVCKEEWDIDKLSIYRVVDARASEILLSIVVCHNCRTERQIRFSVNGEFFHDKKS